MIDVIDSSVDREDHSKSAGAPAVEIEVTPEMIEAGLKVYFLFKPSEDDPEQIIRTVYVEMERYRSSNNKLYS